MIAACRPSYRWAKEEGGNCCGAEQSRYEAAREGLGVAIDLRLSLGSVAGGTSCLIRDRLFSHSVLNGSALYIVGHLGQLRGPDFELFDNFRLDRSRLQISTSCCQPQKIVHTHYHSHVENM
jgi:hypothetical protein